MNLVTAFDNAYRLEVSVSSVSKMDEYIGVFDHLQRFDLVLNFFPGKQRGQATFRGLRRPVLDRR